MKLALFIVAVACVAACCAESESVREKRQSQKPGRFLSLPVAQKCANRKCFNTKKYFQYIRSKSGANFQRKMQLFFPGCLVLLAKFWFLMSTLCYNTG